MDPKTFSDPSSGRTEAQNDLPFPPSGTPADQTPVGAPAAGAGPETQNTPPSEAAPFQGNEPPFQGPAGQSFQGYAPNEGVFQGTGPQPIVNRTQITLERLAQFNATVLKTSFTTLLVCGILLCVVGAIFVLLSAYNPEAGNWLLAILFVFLGVFFLSLAHNLKKPKRITMMQSQPTVACQPWNTYSFDFSGFTVWTQSELENSSSRFAWGALYGAREDEHNFYLQLSPQSGFVVGKDGFSPFDAEALRNLLRGTLGSRFKERNQDGKRP